MRYMNRLEKLETERSNAKTNNLDTMTVKEIISAMNEEDQTVALAVQKVLPQIEEAIHIVHKGFSNSGRLLYIGAGTSGRIGLLDAVECPPTFSTSPKMVQAVLAGGFGAVMVAVEGAEDDQELGKKDLKQQHLTANDVVVGIAASGRTPYVIGALAYAQSVGAKTISLSSNLQSAISLYADVAIEVETGPEVLTGSTRLKAATAHKMVVNMISTASMIQIGKVYKNLMVDVHASNFKLKERAKMIVCEATDSTYEEAEQVLVETGFNVKQAIVMILTGSTAEEGKGLLEKANGKVRVAIGREET